MNDAPAEPIVAIGPPRRWKRWLLLSFGLLMVLLACAIAVAFLQSLYDREVARSRDEIHVQGEPMTAQELDAYYPKPAHERDATELWLAAFDKLRGRHNESLVNQLPIVGSTPEPAPPPGQPWKELALAEQFLGDNADAMQMLHDAARKGGAARYPTDFAQGNAGIEVLMPTYQSIQLAARSLKLEAFVRAHRGDALGAADSMCSGLLLARSLERAPLLTSQILRHSVQVMMINAISHLVPAMRFSDTDLTRLEDELLASDFRSDARRALVGERALGLVDFEALSAEVANGSTELSSEAVDAAAVASYLSFMAKYISAAEQPWPHALLDADAVSDNVGRTLHRSQKITKQLTESMSELMGLTAQATSASRVFALAIALERYRREHGRPPMALEKLVPRFISEVPVDPYTGHDFQYECDGKEFVLSDSNGLGAGKLYVLQEQ